MLKKFPLDKTNGTKYVFFFLSQAPIDHSFTLNLRFLCEVKRKCAWDFPFSITFCFY